MILRLVIFIPILLAVVLFAVNNRELVELGFWPLSTRVDLPVYLLVLAPFAAGLAAGGGVMFLAGGRSRRRARRTRRAVRSMGDDLVRTGEREAARRNRARRQVEIERRDRTAAELAAVAEAEALPPRPRDMPRLAPG